MAVKTGVVITNAHERDAVAAARKAFNHYSNKLRQTAARARLYSRDPATACKQVMQGVKMSEV